MRDIRPHGADGSVSEHSIDVVHEVSQRDYYEVLGIPRDVDAGTMKKAYRKLALENHPDRNPDPEAAARFKEAAEAYSVLSDPEKRARYDVGGHAAVAGRGFDPAAFSEFGDIFGVLRDVFGVDIGSGSRHARPQRGDDLLFELALPFEAAALGVEQELRVPRMGSCEDCGGAGSEAGTGRKKCQECNGAGQVVFRQGFFSMARTCGRCRGEGSVFENPCKACRGAGRMPLERKLKIRVPAGIAEGQRIRVQGEGEPGMLGGPPGDLYVQVSVEKHDLFWREGFDLHLRLPVSFAQVALGASVEVPTLEGVTQLEIPAGTEAGDVIRVKGKGIKRLGATGRGDLLVHVRVRTPKRLSDKQAALLRKYADAVDESYDIREEKSLFDRVKDLLG
jgi:molecular chaperone DnaJ